MPGGDGSGPMGMGPMTGRAAGFCAGYSAPGFTNPAPRRGFARGMGMGFRGGRGWGGFNGAPVPFGANYARSAPAPIAAVPTREQELDALKGQVEYFENALDEVKKRIAELQGKESE